MVVGSLIIYAVGVPWLQLILGLSLGKALAVGMYPFIPGDIIKIIAAYIIVKSVRPLLHPGRQPEPGRAPAGPVD